MICHNLNRLLALSVIFGAIPALFIVQGAGDFEKKVSVMLKQEPENPKCFAETKKDFTCFWEEDEEKAGPVDQYSFTYTYQLENSSSCPLRVLPAAKGKSLFSCHLNQIKEFVDMDIQVHREGILIHNRSLYIEDVFLLDPPANVTVSSTGHQGQLNVSWVNPSARYMDNSKKYEVRYVTADSDVGQTEVVRTGSEIILRDLKPGTMYKVQVRVKLDGVIYNGYWSVWSDPVFMETPPAELDILIVSLTILIILVLGGLVFTVFLSHRRFLVKKIWPTIPAPDSKFKDLFTVYGGDFQEWMGQTSGRHCLRSAFFHPEECLSPVEVLSELHLSPALSSPPVPPKTSRPLMAGRKEDEDVMKTLHDRETLERSESGHPEGWRSTPNDHWLMDQLRALHQDPVPGSHSSLLESQDSYVTLAANSHRQEEHLSDILEENFPLEVFFASRKQKLRESHSDLGSVQPSSGSGHLSSQSSFEYPNQVWMPKGPAYIYMAVADSGVSMDYSPMSRVEETGKAVIYANEYENEIPAHRRPFQVKRQPVHDD
ncbi:erythropoietin receptor isoform X1 [Antennarius striatus]|uniref:erythropoietin receptor isoform X1 n=1 Tax=Antennarius striatus TaxID=241820 RepID=UPI0035B240FE